MDNQEITHKDEGGKESFKFTQRGYMWLNPETLKWSYCNPAFSLRSLADIKELVELRKANAELEKALAMLENYNGSVESLIKEIEANNLEQHDIAIRNAVRTVITPSIANHWNDDYQRGFMDCTTDILNQAKALKEQPKNI
jgi:DNA-binding transcriptional MerR regulator